MATWLNKLLNRRKHPAPSGPGVLIAPEIKDDPFFRAIVRVAATAGVRQILEIGSSSGEGSTAALVKGAQMQRVPPQLHCMEVSKVRHAALAERYRDLPFVHAYNWSSVPIERFPTDAEVARFHREAGSKLSRKPLAEVLEWLHLDRAYLLEQAASCDGIRRIRAQHRIDRFDAVLIDGSEFTGTAELQEVYGARFLLLDDTETYKNWDNTRRLLNDPAYRLVEHKPRLRNGYAIFERVS